MRLFLAAVLLSGFFMSAAQAHDHAQWIMDNPKTAYCCGPRDCFPLAPGEVKITQDGYYLPARKEIVHFQQAKTSIDHQYWLCVTLESGREWPDGETRCFFAPSVGS